MMDNRRQRVVFACHLEVVVQAPWSPDCTIEQVMKQAEDDARLRLQRLQSANPDKGDVYIGGVPKLVRVILDEGDG